MHAKTILADYFCMDAAEMPWYEYQPTHWTMPRLFSFAEGDLFCVPAKGRRVPINYAGRSWAVYDTHKGREIWRAVEEGTE